MSERNERELDLQKRCCGRKPLLYKRPSPYQFCCRCDRAYDMNGHQIENWAWQFKDDDFQRRKGYAQETQNPETKD